ncbi:MAG: hypothetical protein MK219_04550, partial [Candidatus Poseidoniia archaeon]|nr:hypothetical protein [Candidatus Poseidoniia archaeon]
REKLKNDINTATTNTVNIQVGEADKKLFVSILTHLWVLSFTDSLMRARSCGIRTPFNKITPRCGETTI